MKAPCKDKPKHRLRSIYSSALVQSVSAACRLLIQRLQTAVVPYLVWLALN